MHWNMYLCSHVLHATYLPTMYMHTCYVVLAYSDEIAGVLDGRGEPGTS